MDMIPARWRALVLASAAAGVVILAFGYLSGDEGEPNDDAAILPLLVVLFVSAVAGYLLWRYVASARTGAAAGSTALAIGLLSIPLAFFYWTGLVYFVAPVGIAMGADGGTANGRAGMFLSIAALAGALLIGVMDGVL